MILAAGACIAWILVGAVAPTAEEGRVSYSLPNGLRVRLAPDRDAGDVVVLLGIRGGFFAEPAGHPHVAHVAEHLATFAGPGGSEAAKAASRWFAEGRANAETLAHFMYFDLKVRPEELDRALEVQAARLARPEFAPEMLRREVPRTLAELDHLERSALGGTGKFALCAFAQAALGGRDRIAIREETRKLTVEDIRDYWSTTARTDRAILTVVGNFDADAARGAIAKTLGAIPAPEAPQAPKRGALRGVSATWDVETKHVVIAWEVPPPSHPDHAALTLASLPLMLRLHADPDIAALARMPFVANEVDGLFILNAQANPGADLRDLETRLLDRVDRLGREGGIGEAEVAQSRAWLMSALRPGGPPEVPPGVPRVLALANSELQVMMREIAWGDLSAYAKRAEAIDPEGLRSVVSKHLGRDRAFVVRLGPEP